MNVNENENEKNSREINDMLTKLRESVGKDVAKPKAVKKKAGAANAYDGELVALLKKHLGENTDSDSGELKGQNERSEEYSVSDLSIVKDGTVDPGRFGDQIKREELVNATAAENIAVEPASEKAAYATQDKTEETVEEPGEKISDGEENGSDMMPPAVAEALEDAFTADFNQTEVPDKTITSVEPEITEQPFDFVISQFNNIKKSSAGDLDEPGTNVDATETELFTVMAEINADKSLPVADTDADTAEVEPISQSEKADEKLSANAGERQDKPIIFKESTAGAVQEHNDFKAGAKNFTGSMEPSHGNDKSPVISEEELKIMLALGDKTKSFGDKETEELSISKPGKNEIVPEEKCVNGISSDTLANHIKEYTSHVQDEKIKNDYRLSNLVAFFRLAGVALITLTLGVLENIGYFGVKMPDALSPSGKAQLFTLITLGLFLCACTMLWRKLANGFKRTFRFDPEPHSLTAVAAVLNIIYDFIILAIHPETVILYNFPSSLLLVLSALAELFDVRREINTFTIISADEERYTLNESGSISVEDLKKRIPVYSVTRTAFTEGYFRRTNKKGNGIYLLNYILLPVVAVGIVIMIITAGVAHDANESLAAFIASVLVCMPASVLLLVPMPPSLASRRLRKQGCAVVGLSGIDEYSRRKMIVFEDKTMFPSHNIRTKGLKLYDGFEIYDMLIKTGSLFSVIGGPLGEIFDAGNSKYHRSGNIKLIKAERGGVEALLDGSVHLLAGNYEFLEKYGIYPKRNPRDEQLASAGEVTIIYIAIDKRAAARLYIDYRSDADFERAAELLTDSGNKVAIRTADPGIDEMMIERKRGADGCEIRVLRAGVNDISVNSEAVDSGIVALGTPCSLAEPICVTSELKRVRRRGLVTMLGIFIINIVFSAILAVTDTLGFIVSGVAAIYLLLWLLPVLFITFSAFYEW